MDRSIDAATPAVLDTLGDLSLVLVTGKGGVGKSTLTAVIGRALAARGRRTLLVEADARESLYPLLGVDPSGGDIVEVEPNLSAQIVRPRDVFDMLVAQKLRFETLVRKVTESEIYRHFVDGAPGFKELAVLGHALDQTQEGHADVVVVDSPATGHGMSMLSAPTLVRDVIRGGPIGEMTAQLAEFIEDPAKCSAVVVTLAEEMPVQETVELIERMRAELDRSPAALIVNGLYPVEGNAVPPLFRGRAEVQRRETQRLEKRWLGPRADLPLLPLGTGPELVSALLELLES